MGENTNESEKERTQMIDGRGKKERKVIDWLIDQKTNVW
jgi:hypothetical protein